MKIITLNLRTAVRAFSLGVRLLAFFMILTLSVHISSMAFESSDLRAEEVVSIAEKRTVIIDAGHGGEDCGAIGISGVYEKDLNLIIAGMVGDWRVQSHLPWKPFMQRVVLRVVSGVFLGSNKSH